MNKEQTLGEGSVVKLIVALAIPAVISQVVNMLYNIVDRIYIGHIPETGVAALTGLGLCYPIIMIVSAFSSLFGMGGAPRAAIAMGKNNNEEAEKILGNCVTALMISAIVLMSILLIFGENLLYLFGASDNTIIYALDYLRIYAIGTMFVQITLGLNTFITTQGFAKFSMLTVVIGAVTNIILDPIFIYGLNMGVKGAALATTISQALSAIWVLKFLCGKKTKLKIQKKNMKLSPAIILPVMALGLSPFVMSSTESILNICFNVSLQKYGGDLAVGAMTILGSVMSLSFMPLTGITQGIQPIISFNYGARKFDRVKSAIKYEIAICTGFTTLVWVFLMIVPQVFISLFNNDPTLLAYTIWSMRVYAAMLFVIGLQVACQQIFVALGYAKISVFLACLRKIILLIPLIFILPNFFEDKVFAVFLAEPIADVLAATTTVITFIVLMRSLFREKSGATK
ncbi:MAG: MATE family efflux transporter [Eubacteriales bacterium]